MKCVICKGGETRPGKATVVLERAGTTVVFNRVPAQVCQDCGEEYVDESIAGVLLEQADTASKSKATLEIREYTA